eukprot:74261_1
MMNSTTSKRHWKTYRRRQRKAKQNISKTKCIDHKSCMNKFRIIEHHEKLKDILVSGYLHQIIESYSRLPLEIEILCYMYCNEEKIVDKLKPSSYGQLTLDETFNDLYVYEKMIFCRRIIRSKQFAIHNLRVYPHIDGCSDRDTLSLRISQQFFFIEYILCKHYNTVSKLDLSQMYMNDCHVLYFCNAIENMIQYFEDVKNEREISNTKRIKVWMRLEELNLSTNDISDQYFDLLLRTIKRYAPRMKRLILSSNNISDKSLASVIKYQNKRLVVDLSNCKGVTLLGLNKYARTEKCGRTERHVYCETMVYFINDKEEQPDFIRQRKGKRFKGNRNC